MLPQNVISFARKTTTHWANRWLEKNLDCNPLTLLDCFEVEWEELETNLRNFLLWKNDLHELVYEKTEEKFEIVLNEEQKEYLFIDTIETAVWEVLHQQLYEHFTRFLTEDEYEAYVEGTIPKKAIGAFLEKHLMTKVEHLNVDWCPCCQNEELIDEEDRYCQTCMEEEGESWYLVSKTKKPPRRKFPQRTITSSTRLYQQGQQWFQKQGFTQETSWNYVLDKAELDLNVEFQANMSYEIQNLHDLLFLKFENL